VRSARYTICARLQHGRYPTYDAVPFMRRGCKST